MITRDRRLLEQILKQWAQDHTVDYIIADYSTNNEALETTQNNLNWVVKNDHASVDLFALANKMEEFIESRRKRQDPDGLICQRCKVFYDFAEANQPDGSLICYVCRKNPYR